MIYEKEIYDLTADKLISELKKYPKDTRIVFDVGHKGLFANFYPLNSNHGSYSTRVIEGQYEDTVCIVLRSLRD